MAYKDRIRELRKVKASELIPAVNNWRKHPPHQVKALRTMLEQVGWAGAAIAREQDGKLILIDGHLRASLDKDDEVPVLILDVNEQEADQLLASFDPITSMAEADRARLADLLKATGTDKLRELWESIARNQRTQLTQEDNDDFDLEAVREKPKYDVHPGEKWQLGQHVLVCGDVTRTEDVDLLMGGAKSTMVFTDPPYNVDYGSTKNPKFKIRKIENDKQDAGAWEQFCKRTYAAFKTHNTGDIYLWGASGPEGMKARLWLVEMGAHWSATIIWRKNSLLITPANYQRQYEPCFYGWFGKSSYNDSRIETEVWDCKKPSNSKLHPTMKPLEICGRAILNSSLPNDIVLDVFGGSGSTLIACEQAKRRCFMLEIDPVYCSVIIERWEKLTGQQAVRA